MEQHEKAKKPAAYRFVALVLGAIFAIFVVWATYDQGHHGWAIFEGILFFVLFMVESEE